MVAVNKALMALLTWGIIVYYVEPADAKEEKSGHVYVPCARYAEGDAWVYDIKTDSMSSSTESVVLSNKDGVIIIGDKTKTLVKMGNPPRTVEMVNESQKTYRKEGATIFLVGNTVENASFLQGEMRIPACGEIPKVSSNATKFSNGTIEETSKVRIVGHERVNVPAGKFETIVFERTSEGGPGSGLMESNKRIETSFVVEKIGPVRVLIKTYQPVVGARMDPEVEAQANEIMQKGIAAMAKGDDATEYLKRVEELSKSQASQSNTSATVREMTITMELQRYHLN